MKNLSRLAFTILLCTIISKSSFSQTVRNYNLSNFQKLKMGSAFTINVTEGKSFKVISKGKKSDLDELEVYVRNNTLYAEFKNKWSLFGNNNHDKIEFQIEMPTISAVNFSGASNSIVTGFDDLRGLEIDLSGASKSKIDVFATDVSIDVSGASNLKMIGRANKLNISMSGASDIEAINFPVQNANIDASVASGAKLSVSNQINVDASGAANIKYVGSPKVHKSTSGGANISKISK